MMCIISQERIAFYTQVEGMWGEVFTASPITLKSRCKHVPNEPIPTYGQIWPSTPECSFHIRDRQSKKKRRNYDGRAICTALCGIGARRRVNCHQDDSNGSDRPHPLSLRHSTQTELFFADVCTPNIWRRIPILLSTHYVFSQSLTSSANTLLAMSVGFGSLRNCISCSWVQSMTNCTGCSTNSKHHISRINLTINSDWCHTVLASYTSLKRCIRQTKSPHKVKQTVEWSRYLQWTALQLLSVPRTMGKLQWKQRPMKC
jgi:hypothetical protein